MCCSLATAHSGMSLVGRERKLSECIMQASSCARHAACNCTIGAPGLEGQSRCPAALSAARHAPFVRRKRCTPAAPTHSRTVALHCMPLVLTPDLQGRSMELCAAAWRAVFGALGLSVSLVPLLQQSGVHSHVCSWTGGQGSGCCQIDLSVRQADLQIYVCWWYVCVSEVCVEDGRVYGSCVHAGSTRCTPLAAFRWCSI